MSASAPIAGAGDERLFLLVAIAGREVAIDAALVASVIELGEITPVPRVPRHVRGLHALRSRVLTVIDARLSIAADQGAADQGAADQAAVDPAPPPSAAPASAVVLEVEGHGYALVVDAVLDVVTAPPPAAAVALLGAGWARVVAGRVAVAGGWLPLVDPAALVEGPAAQAA